MSSPPQKPAAPVLARAASMPTVQRTSSFGLKEAVAAVHDPQLSNPGCADLDMTELMSGLLGGPPPPPATMTVARAMPVAPQVVGAATAPSVPLSHAAIPLSHAVVVPGQQQQLPSSLPPVVPLLPVPAPHHSPVQGTRSVVVDLQPPTVEEEYAAEVDADRSSDLPTLCWGGVLKGSSDMCTPGFTSGKAHFKNKFCKACREGIVVPATRVRALTPEMQQLYNNSLRAGFWKHASPAIGGGEVRIANNTITCDGPWLVVYRGLPPPHLPFCTMPEEWIDDGIVKLAVAKGTLVPAYEMTHTGRKSGSLAAPGSAPKRQRRAGSNFSATSTLAALPSAHVLTLARSTSLQSNSSVASSSVALTPQLSAQRSMSLSSNSSVALAEPGTPTSRLASVSITSDRSPPSVASPAIPPPSAMAPPPVVVGGGSMLNCSSLPSATSLSSSDPGASPSQSMPSATPLSPRAQLASQLTAAHEHTASLLEAALQPSSPLYAQLSPIQIEELRAQLATVRNAIATSRRILEPSYGGARPILTAALACGVSDGGPAVGPVASSSLPPGGQRVTELASTSDSHSIPVPHQEPRHGRGTSPGLVYHPSMLAVRGAASRSKSGPAALVSLERRSQVGGTSPTHARGRVSAREHFSERIRPFSRLSSESKILKTKAQEADVKKRPSSLRAGLRKMWAVFGKRNSKDMDGAVAPPLGRSHSLPSSAPAVTSASTSASPSASTQVAAPPLPPPTTPADAGTGLHFGLAELSAAANGEDSAAEALAMEVLEGSMEAEAASGGSGAEDELMWGLAELQAAAAGKLSSRETSEKDLLSEKAARDGVSTGDAEMAEAAH